MTTQVINVNNGNNSIEYLEIKAVEQYNHQNYTTAFNFYNKFFTLLLLK
jgi:hypothetical protein